MHNVNKHTKMQFKPKQYANLRTVRTCSYHCAQTSHTVQHRTVLTIFATNLQTIITALMLSVGGEVEYLKQCQKSRPRYEWYVPVTNGTFSDR